MGVWMDDGWMGDWLGVLMVRWMAGLMDAWMGGWMSECVIDGWMGGW